MSPAALAKLNTIYKEQLKEILRKGKKGMEGR
jgi:hypothetical protein